jgi:hypothetical protein
LAARGTSIGGTVACGLAEGDFAGCFDPARVARRQSMMDGFLDDPAHQAEPISRRRFARCSARAEPVSPQPSSIGDGAAIDSGSHDGIDRLLRLFHERRREQG